MKRCTLGLMIVGLAIIGLSGCKSKPQVSGEKREFRELVLVNLGLCWDPHATPPDPRELWEYPSWGNVRVIDVTDWKIGEDVIEISGGPDQRNTFYYPWQGEDTIYHFVTGPYLWVNEERVGAKLWEVYYDDIPDPEDIVTVVADPSEVRYFKHLPNLDVAHVVIVPDQIDESFIVGRCIETFIEELRSRPSDFSRIVRFCQTASIFYRGWIELHFIRDKPLIYLTSRPIAGIDFLDEVPSNHELARFSRINNIQGLEIWSDELEPNRLGRVLPGFKELRRLRLCTTNINDGVLYSISRIPDLRSLELCGACDEFRFDSKGLRHLQELTSLTKLKLSYFSISDTGLMYISRIPNLRTLVIYRCDVTDTGLRYLGGLESLRDLGICCSWVPDTVTDYIIKYLVITDSTLMYFGNLKGLRRLDLRITYVTPEGVARLRKALPDCEIVW